MARPLALEGLTAAQTAALAGRGLDLFDARSGLVCRHNAVLPTRAQVEHNVALADRLLFLMDRPS